MVVPAVAAAFARDVVVSEAVDLPVSARDERRRQYLSTALLDVVERAHRPAWERLLGVADVDLFAAGLNFVFGEADPRAGVAVMSLARLRHADTEVFRRRAETEAIHELGHAYGLGHCGNPRCVMWFSNTLAETDRKGTALLRGPRTRPRTRARAVTSRSGPGASRTRKPPKVQKGRSPPGCLVRS